MKLFLLTQTENTGYDTYDSMVVAAESEDGAALTHPAGTEGWYNNYFKSSWATTPKNVTATYLGTAKKGTKSGIINASFNAG